MWSGYLHTIRSGATQRFRLSTLPSTRFLQPSCLQLWTPQCSVLSSVTFRRRQSSVMGFTDSPTDNTARLVVVLHVPGQYTAVCCCLCNRGTVLATIHELQPTGGRRSVPFKSDVIRLRSTIFVHCAFQAWFAFPPHLLRTSAAAVTNAHSDARGRRHVSWPLPVQPTRPIHTPLWASSHTPSWPCELPVYSLSPVDSATICCVDEYSPSSQRKSTRTDVERNASSSPAQFASVTVLISFGIS